MEENKLLVPQKLNTQSETIDLAEIFWSYFIHWRWILLSIFVSFGVGYVYFRTQPNIYRVSASVLVKSPDEKGGGAQSALLDELGFKSGGNVENEVEVFRSKRLLVGVVDSLGLNISYYYKTIFTRLHELYKESPIRVRVDKDFMKSMGASSMQLTLTPSDNGSFEAKGECKGVPFSQKLKSLPSSLSTVAGVVYIESKVQNLSAIPRPILVVIKNTKSAIGGLSIESSVGKKNEVITLTTTSQNPTKGIDVLNMLIASYNRDAMNQINQSAINTAEFIDGRLKYLTVELSDVEKDVEKYKKSNNFTDISAEAASFLGKSTALDVKRIENETQLRLVQFVEEFVVNEKNIFSPIPNLGLTDVNISASLGKYNDLLMNRIRLSESSSFENPLVESLNKQIYALRKAILIGVKNVRKGLLIQQEDIRKADNSASGRLSEIPRQEREYIEIKRQQEIKAQLYIFLLQKREESALSMAITVPKAIVINEAELVGQVSPNRNFILLVAFMLGFLLPIVIIYLMDLFNTKIITREDVRRLTDLPILSEMSHSLSLQQFAVSETSLDATNELFRLLRTKLNFTLNAPQEKVILITSTEPEEGKTFISVNLALSLAMTDKRVLLVGLDLRKPQLVNRFGISQKEGITSYLSGQENDIFKLIHTSVDYPNLSILPAGVIPPNPNELLMRDKLKEAFVLLKDHFDVILLDSAPIGVVSDTLLLVPISDITLYVCRSGFTLKRSFDVINRLTEDHAMNRMYLILNDLSKTGGYYKDKYSYGYGYGYKEGVEKKKTKGLIARIFNM
jgi:capsular exopolysaccharide synthesis family protein